jgi:hypothetical protein
VAKPDYLRAQQKALQEIEQLRARGDWDRRHTNAT